jgi:hypothetical protein
MAMSFAVFHINHDQHGKIPETREARFAGSVQGDGGHGSYLVACISVKVIAAALLVHWERLGTEEKFDISYSFPSRPVTFPEL